MSALRRLLTVVFWAVLAAGPAAFAEETDLPVRRVAFADSSFNREEPASLAERFTLPERHSEIAEVSSPSEPESPEAGPAARNAAVPPASRQASRKPERARLAVASDILLLIQRQNE